MINRIVKFTEENIFQEEEEMNLDELVEKVKTAEGYMVSVSLKTGDKIEHALITENFPKIDMLPAHNRLKELIVENLEEDRPILHD